MEIHISAFSAKLHVRDGLFETVWLDENGMAQKHEYAPAKVKSIWLQEGTVVTVAAVLLALREDIDLVFLDKSGMPVSRQFGFELGSHSGIQKGQAMAAVDGLGLEFVRAWLGQKMANQADFLERLKSRRDGPKQLLLDENISKIRQQRQQLLAIEAHKTADVAEAMRGHEGTASRHYFQTISALLPEEYQFDHRSRQPAEDIFNAFLNYAYGWLYSKTQRALLLAGLNPYLGFLHRDDYRHKSMLFDFIEPWRVWVERPLFHLFSRKAITSAHVAPAPEGKKGLWLHAAGKKILLDALAIYFAENKPEMDGLIVSRDYFMFHTARRTSHALLEHTGRKLPARSQKGPVVGLLHGVFAV